MSNEPGKLDLLSFDIAENKWQELLRLFPEVRTESGKIDFDYLKLALAEAVDVDKERYGIKWPGKADCFKTIQTPSLGTLLPYPEESVNFDATENLIIEGDNLEVLKLLQKSYLAKVKMIYIDPPYNTGNDFIYPDNYTESLQTYLEYTGQLDGNRKKFSTNTDTDGRFHSKWLNMMYPRLYLARNLLREDGVIFVSISDDEIHNLRHLMDDVFGPDNFIGCIIWNSTKSVTNTALISVSHTFNLVYARSKDYFVKNRSHFRLPEDGTGFSNPDNDPRGPWKADPFQVGGERPNQMYSIKNPKTGEIYRPNPGCSWKNEFEVFKHLLADNRIVFGASGEAGPQRKRFLSEAEERGKVAKTLWDNVETTANATQTLKEIVGYGVFNNPKPVSLIQRFIQLGAHDPVDAIILDFFAGSGTTAHAVLEQNNLDSGNRKFILVQLPEPLDASDKDQKTAVEFCDFIGKPRNIAEITKERVRRISKKLNDEKATKEPGPSDVNASNQDYGFQVFKLAESNFKPWNAEMTHDEQNLVQQLELYIDHIREGRSQEDILYEIMLKSGFPLTALVETLQLTGKTVYSVAEGALFICLERQLTLELMRAMADKKPERVVCLDVSFAGNDQLKSNAVQIFRTKGVTSFKTV